jgi:predicted RNase H-like nuclease
VPAILGIDAAWTGTEPSGVALLRGDGATWKCIVVAPSYSSFIAAGDGLAVDWSTAPTPGWPDVDALLGAAKTLLNGTAVDLVMIDMPVSMDPITGRRAAGNAISKAFGGKGCSVHTPNSRRPGPIADLLRLRHDRVSQRVDRRLKSHCPIVLWPYILLNSLDFRAYDLD